jgi:hypothetical protein
LEISIKFFFLPVPNQLDKESLKQRSNKKDKPHKAFHISCGEQNDTKQTYHTTHRKKKTKTTTNQVNENSMQKFKRR